MRVKYYNFVSYRKATVQQEKILQSRVLTEIVQPPPVSSVGVHLRFDEVHTKKSLEPTTES